MGAESVGRGGAGSSEEDPPPGGSDDDLRLLAARRSQGHQSIGSMVYDILKEAILDGTLRPGLKLRQEVLAEKIGVSRVPVRSALIQLGADGLVQLRGRRSAVVRSITAAQVREIYELRAVLESHAVRVSMVGMTSQRLARLRELAQVVDAEQEGPEFVDARSEFYAELYDATNNPTLWELIEQLRLKVGRYLLGWRMVEVTPHSHESLLEAVSRNDVDSAVRDICHHLELVRDGVLEKLEDETP
jgi:DNA-binding GntR family transcriptional regulator